MIQIGSVYSTVCQRERLGRFAQATKLLLGVFPLFLPLAITAPGDPESYFSLAIIAFGAFQFIASKYYDRLGKVE